MFYPALPGAATVRGGVRGTGAGRPPHIKTARATTGAGPTAPDADEGRGAFRGTFDGKTVSLELGSRANGRPESGSDRFGLITTWTTANAQRGFFFFFFYLPTMN